MVRVTKYEYGIQHHLYPGEPHREGMTRAEALDWLSEFLEDGGCPEAFEVIRRPVGEWEVDHAPS